YASKTASRSGSGTTRAQAAAFANNLAGAAAAQTGWSESPKQPNAGPRQREVVSARLAIDGWALGRSPGSRVHHAAEMIVMIRPRRCNSFWWKILTILVQIENNPAELDRCRRFHGVCRRNCDMCPKAMILDDPSGCAQGVDRQEFAI